MPQDQPTQALELPPTTRSLAGMRLGAGLLGAMLAAGSLLAAPAAAVAAGGAIVVTTLADTSADDGVCSLREALVAAAAATAGGDCEAGDAAGSVITFDAALTGTITLGAALPRVTTPLSVDGGGRITISGADAWSGFDTGDGLLELASLTITHTTSAFGGAVTADGDVSLDGVTISSTSGSMAGAVYSGGTVTAAASLITGTTTAGGGAIRARDVTVDGGSFTSNTATGGPGAILVETGSLSVSDARFFGNAGTNGGAIGLASVSTGTISGSTFDANQASVDGGAVWAGASTDLVVANATFLGNSAAGSGGAVRLLGTARVRSVTFVANSAAVSGGGLAVAVPAVTLTGSLFAANAAPSGRDTSGSLAADTGNVRSDSATDVVATVLADHGGPTPTLAVPSGSPAVNAGDATACATPEVGGLDQRGLARDAACDAGAYERDNQAPVVTLVPPARLATGTLKGSSVPIRATWLVTDPGTSGYRTARVEQSVDGGGWTLAAAAVTGNSLVTWLAPGHSVRFRVTATDGDGNTGAVPVVSAAVVVPTLVQQSYAGITYRRTWTFVSASATAPYSGGSTRYATVAGSSAQITFTGRGAAWVTAKGPSRGKAYVYVNGVLDATVDLYAPTPSYRVVAWSKAFGATRNISVKVVVAGTAGRPRVDLDAFIQLR